MHTVANGSISEHQEIDHGESRQGLKSQLRLPNDLVKKLKTINPYRSTWSLIHTYALAAGLLTVFIVIPSPIKYMVWPVLGFLMARTLHALAILMHDASHRTLYANPAVNDFVGKWLCAYPIGISLFAYRKLHFRHHKDLYSERDPDIPLYAGYPREPGDLAGKAVRDFFGLTTHKNYLYLLGIGIPRKGKGPNGKNSNDLIEVAVFQAVLWTVLILTGWWQTWLLMVTLPMLTFLQVALRFRGAAEHAAVPDTANPVANVRTTLGNPASRFLFAPLFVNYHLEHHLYPAVPHYNLPKIHEALDAQGSLKDALVCRGYWDFAKSLVKPKRGVMAA